MTSWIGAMTQEVEVGDLVHKVSQVKGRFTRALWRVLEVRAQDNDLPMLKLRMVHTGTGEPHKEIYAAASLWACQLASPIIGLPCDKMSHGQAMPYPCLD